MKKTEIYFWTFFFTLNFLLFLPRYILEADTSTFFPVGFVHATSLFDLFKYFFNRFNYDIFRISLDFTYIIILVLLFRKYIKINIAFLLLFVVYLVLLIYQVYYHVFEKLYQVNPLFFNDLKLIETGISIIFEQFSWWLFLIITAIIIFIAGLGYTFYKFMHTLANTHFGKISWYMIGGIAIALLYSQFRYGFHYMPNLAYPNIVASIVQNIRESSAYSDYTDRIDIQKIIASNDIRPEPLAHTPDIYLLFIESYGRIVYDDPSIKERYIRCIEKNQRRLRENDLYCCSALSKSPVTGGVSWISYGSLLYGFNMGNQGMYDFFLQNDELNDYMHMMRFFRSNGYKNYRVNSVYPHENMVIPWDDYTRFYAVDEWITYDDLQYNGKLYGFGPAPPDQYSLNYAVSEIVHPDSVPYTLFFMSQNSHNPFYSPDSVASDWRNLNTGSGTVKPRSVFMKKPEREDYIHSIEYQINYLTDFMVNADKNSIFIIIGDHQPPVLTTIHDGFETPVHIISSDSSFVSGFVDYGMSRGMDVNMTQDPMKHEGIYSMFMRELLRNYSDIDSLPKYRPNGIPRYE